MTRDTRQQRQLPYQHHRRGVSGIAGHDVPRQGTMTMSMAGLSPNDGYDWLQRIGRTRATQAMGSA